MAEKRNSTLDLVRIMAILAVVLTHSSAPFVDNYEMQSAEFFWGSIFDGISRMGVPLFVMISGALFLDERRKVTVKQILCKNVKNLAIITITWAAIYTLVYHVILPVMASREIVHENVLNCLINGYGHMWYLYMIMGLYIITPFLRKFVSIEDGGMVRLFIAISFTASFLLPVVDKLLIRYLDIYYLGILVNRFSLDFFGGYIAYYLLGWYIVHVRIAQKGYRYSLYFLGLLSLLFMIGYAVFTGDYGTAFDNISAPVFLYSAGVFLAVNEMKLQIRAGTAGILQEMARLTFGVYLVHMLAVTLFSKIFPYSVRPCVYILLCFAVTAGSSFAAAYVISKIPVIRKMIKT